MKSQEELETSTAAGMYFMISGARTQTRLMAILNSLGARLEIRVKVRRERAA